jgi:hypothetical protein
MPKRFHLERPDLAKSAIQFFLLFGTGLFFIAGCENLKNSPGSNSGVSNANGSIVAQNGIPFSPNRTDDESDEYLDLNSMPQVFKDYDQQFISKVKHKWDAYLVSAQINHNDDKFIILKFHLNSDGTISNIDVVESTADESTVSMCKRVLSEISPKPWPDEMRKKIGRDYCEVTFTFDY